MRVVLAQPRGFCAGVERAIEIVERALEKYGPPIYVRHEIVHNRHVVERLRAKGARFVDEIDEVPPGAVTIFSAHGVAQRDRAARRRARPAGHRRHLPAGVEGAHRGPALRQSGTRDHPDRACRPPRDRRHDGPHHRAGAPDLAARGGGAACRSPIPTSSPSSPRRRSGRRHARRDRGAEGAVSRRSSGPTRRISATRPRTASARRGNWRKSSMLFSSWARRTARTRTGCARSPRNAACRAT